MMRWFIYKSGGGFKMIKRRSRGYVSTSNSRRNLRQTNRGSEQHSRVLKTKSGDWSVVFAEAAREPPLPY